MKPILVVVVSVMTISTAMGQFTSGGSLSVVLAPYKFRHVQLLQHGVNLSLHGTLNRRSATLILSTGAPISVLDRNSIAKFGIAERKTAISLSSPFGKTSDYVGLAKVQSFEFLNIVLTDFETGTIDESVMNRIAPPHSIHIDGVFGYSQMLKLGAVIDCVTRDLYVNPWGSRVDASGQLKKVLLGRGYVRVPMRLNTHGQPEVDCKINGQVATITVETAAFTTIVNNKFATNAGVAMTNAVVKGEGVGRRQGPLKSGIVQQFSIGSFQSKKGKIRVGDLIFNVLGIDFLSSNHAVIDTAGMNLFLHP